MRMFLILSLLLLSACGNETMTIRSTRNVVVTPDEGVYNCQVVDTFPESATLTDSQVARLIVTLYQNNVQCRNSIDAIKSFLENARQTVSAEPSAETPSLPR
jgi:hypothetical protein